MDNISDFCFLVQDLDRAVHFYRDVVGFRLRRATVFSAARVPHPAGPATSLQPPVQCQGRQLLPFAESGPESENEL